MHMPYMGLNVSYYPNQFGVIRYTSDEMLHDCLQKWFAFQKFHNTFTLYLTWLTFSLSFLYLVLALIPLDIVIVVIFLSLSTCILLSYYVNLFLKDGVVQYLPQQIDVFLQRECLIDVFCQLCTSGKISFYISRIVMLIFCYPNNDEILRLLDGWSPHMIELMTTRGVIHTLPTPLQRIYSPALAIEDRPQATLPDCNLSTLATRLRMRHNLSPSSHNPQSPTDNPRNSYINNVDEASKILLVEASKDTSIFPVSLGMCFPLKKSPIDI